MMTTYKKSIIVLFVILSFFTVIHSTYAFSTNLIICNTQQDLTGSPKVGSSNYNANYGGFTDPCDFQALVQLATNFVNLLIVYSVPIAVISFIYAGYLLLTAAGNSGQVSRAKTIFFDTVIGFFFVLAAWLIVSAITGTLLLSQFNPLISNP